MNKKTLDKITEKFAEQYCDEKVGIVLITDPFGMPTAVSGIIYGISHTGNVSKERVREYGAKHPAILVDYKHVKTVVQLGRTFPNKFEGVQVKYLLGERPVLE
ncbi:hypothetical protein HY837_06850 [archaeon]|nr:hypothetical protein [archaeon]